jgi:large subunit ribosomal protein L16
VALHFGEYGLQSLERGFITYRQLEAVRRVFVARSRRFGRSWVRTLFDGQRSKKAKGARRGAGKGLVRYYVAQLAAGQTFREFSGLSPQARARGARVAARKVSVRLALVAHRTPLNPLHRKWYG